MKSKNNHPIMRILGLLMEISAIIPGFFCIIMIIDAVLTPQNRSGAMILSTILAFSAIGLFFLGKTISGKPTGTKGTGKEGSDIIISTSTDKVVSTIMPTAISAWIQRITSILLWICGALFTLLAMTTFFAFYSTVDELTTSNMILVLIIAAFAFLCCFLAFKLHKNAQLYFNSIKHEKAAAHAFNKQMKELENQQQIEEVNNQILEQQMLREKQLQVHQIQLQQEQNAARFALEMEQQRQSDLKQAAHERIQRKIQMWEADEQAKHEHAILNWQIHKSTQAQIDEQFKTIDSMEGHQFEYFCAQLLLDNGFTNASVTKGTGDQGVDVLAEKDGIRYAIQCKNYTSRLGNSPVQEVSAGKLFYNCHIAAVMTNSTLTTGAMELAKATNVLV